MALLAHVYCHDTVHENDRIDRIQRMFLPLDNFIDDSAGHIANKRDRHIDVV